MVIPEYESKLLESMASVIVSALRRDDDDKHGDIIAFLLGLREILALEQLVAKEIAKGIYGRRFGKRVEILAVKIHSDTIDEENEFMIWDDMQKDKKRLLV